MWYGLFWYVLQLKNKKTKIGFDYEKKKQMFYFVAHGYIGWKCDGMLR